MEKSKSNLKYPLLFTLSFIVGIDW